MGAAGSYTDQPWATRVDTLGDIAEEAFEQVWPWPWERYGFNRPTVEVYTMSPFVAHTPDYITNIGGPSSLLVEVQGNKGAHKFKTRKLEMLTKWNNLQPTTLWLWDSNQKTSVWISLPTLRLLIAQGKATKGTFDGHKPYWSIQHDILLEYNESDLLIGRYGG